MADNIPEIDTEQSINMERIKLSSIYHQRFNETTRGIGFHNCAGFAKYIIGLSENEKYVNTADTSAAGLIGFLSQEAVIPFSNFSDQEWIDKSKDSNVVGFLHNDQGEWRYLHFVVPNPDPNKPFEVFHRNGFEEENPEISDIREVIQDKDFEGDTTLVFLKLKDEGKITQQIA